MSIIAEFTVPSDNFALHHSLSAAPEMIVEIERVVATMNDRIMPYFWVSGGDKEEFGAAFEADDSVHETMLVDEMDDSILYRAEWTENVESIVYAYTDVGATILRATGRDEEWELQFRFDDQQSTARFQAHCEENGVHYELKRLYEEAQPMASAQYGLTNTQRETLLTALEEGYFDVPQRTSLDELASMLDISPQAVSKRLHKGHKSLLTNTIKVSHPQEDDEAV